MSGRLPALFAALVLSACASTTDRSAQPRVAASEAAAAVTSADAATTASNAPGGPDEVVCINERVTGSRQKRQMCRTREEWAAVREDSREVTRNLQRRNPYVDSIE